MSDDRMDLLSEVAGPTLKQAMAAMQKARETGADPAAAKELLRQALNKNRKPGQSAHLHEPDCRACSDVGMLSVSREGGSTFAVRCLCAIGQRQGRSIQSVDEVFSGDELKKFFPNGMPATIDTMSPRLAQAGLPPRARNWTLESFKAHFADSEMAIKFAAWVPLWGKKPLSERGDILLAGTNGTGKTGLAVSIVRGCVDRGETVKWWYVPELFTEWRATFGAQTGERDFQRQLVGYDVLVLDEFAGANMSEFVQTSLMTIIHLRQQQNRPTVITMNVNVEKDGTLNKSSLVALLGPALADRVRELGQLWPLAGPSQRRSYGSGKK